MFLHGIKAMARKAPSPYNLTGNDNPGNVITQVQFRGENYEEWPHAMRTSLRARRKWGLSKEPSRNPKKKPPKMGRPKMGCPIWKIGRLFNLCLCHGS